ncbi:MAG: acyltransferase family protein [Bacteroidales bacterium]|nr:acyltransferase family protein [Bacteroidales bacterium]
MKTRIYFLDNLRTFLIFLVVLLHAGMSYESGFDSFWIVSDPAKLNPIAWVRTYLDLFVMFIIFFISGYFIPISLKTRSTWDLLSSKFKRIMIPWIIAVFTLIPTYKAIFLFSRGLPQEEWFSYFHLFHRAGADLYFFANNPTQSWLWFLPILFLFQVMYLALSKTKLLSLKISLKTGMILTILIGLFYSMIISISGLKGWAHSALLDFQRERLLVYFMVFLLGSLCYKLNVFESKTKNTKQLLLAIAVLIPSLIVYTIVAFNFFLNIIDPERNSFIISELIDRLFYYSTIILSMLGFLYVLIFIFRFKFNRSYEKMEPLNKGSYQVYIIHMIVLGVIALILVNINIPAIVKYLVLTVLTYTISNIIVFAYKRIFRKIISLKMTGAIVLAAVILSIVVYIKQAHTNGVNKQSSVLLETPSALDIGIHEAVITGNMDAVMRHIKAGSTLNEKEPMGGSSPLISAATFGKTEVALALIEAGADVNSTNNEGSTALHTAAFFCRMEIVEALLANGADKSIKNNVGSTALDSVTAPYEAVKGIYEYFGTTFAPLGLKLDYEQIEMTRPRIAEILR